jgi:hypothetical protein
MFINNVNNVCWPLKVHLFLRLVDAGQRSRLAFSILPEPKIPAKKGSTFALMSFAENARAGFQNKLHAHVIFDPCFVSVHS